MTRSDSAKLRTLTPVEYALAYNAERNATAKAEGWSAWTLAPEDAEWYAMMGYETAYDYVYSCAKGTLSDIFKEINGFRPRGMYDWAEMDLDAVEAEIDRILEADRRRLEAKARWEAARREEEAKAEAEEAAALAACREPGTPLTWSPFAALAK